MSAVKLELFDFSEPHPRDNRLTVTPGEVEDVRLGAFERGYAAGWEDAVAAQDQAAGRLREEVAAAMSALVLTQRQAGEAVHRATLPVLEAVLSALIPALAGQVLPTLLLEEIARRQSAASEVRLGLHIAPAQRLLAEALLGQEPALEVREDPSLAPGQVVLVQDGQEHRFDNSEFVQGLLALARAHLPLLEPSDDRD